MPSNKVITRGLTTHDRVSGQSTANSPITVTPVLGELRRILFVTFKYSDDVTVAATITLNSGVDSAFDVLLASIAFTGESDKVWYPDGELILSGDDTIDVLAPAGGVGVTGAIAVYSEIF